MIPKATTKVTKLTPLRGIPPNKEISNEPVRILTSAKGSIFIGIAFVNKSVIILAKTEPLKLTKIERIRVTKEIINSSLKFFQSDLTKRLTVPFLGLAYCLIRGAGILITSFLCLRLINFTINLVIL